MKRSNSWNYTDTEDKAERLFPQKQSIDLT